MLIKSKHSGWSPDGIRTPFVGGGGGGGTQQSTGTTYNTNIPDYAKPYVENMLGATQKELFNLDDSGQITGFKPYTPYSTDPSKYVAGFQPLQESAMRSVGQMQVPGQIGQASGLAGMAGLGSLGAAQQAMGAGQQYNQMAQDPSSMQGFMSPYMQNVVDFQKQSALRDYQVAQPMRQAEAVAKGAFGGSRQAIVDAEAQRNLNTQLQGIQATGTQKAFEDAQKQQQFGANLGMQGLQTGLQGYGQMGQAASTLGSLGSQQFGLQKDIVGLQSQFGKEQQAMEQQKINQAIQDWANTQQYPLMQLGVMSNMLRGLPMQSATSNQYVAAPNALTQGIGLAGAGASIFNAMKKEGGVIKEMASGGITSYRGGGDVEGAIESQLYDMQPDDLTRYIKEASSPSVKRMAQRILKEKTNLAGGGIIAFQNRGEVEDKEARRGQQLLENYNRELAENIDNRFEFGGPKLLSDATPRPVPAPPVERANPAAVAAAYRDAEALRPPVTPPPVKPPSGIQALNEAIINRASSLPKDFPAELSYEFDKNRSDLRQKAIEQGARVKPRETPAASEAPSKTETSKEAGIKAASKTTDAKAEPKAEPKAAPATAGGGTGIKAAPSDKIMPTAGIKLPDTGVPGLQMPVAPVDPDAGKTTAQIAGDKEAYMGPNLGARETMAKLMAERANATDEARRISALRMAEFFGAWGSTPGNTIVAGLNTLKNKVPDLIGDMKEATKIRRQIDKDISEIEKIERLEKSGNYDEAAKRKAELGKNALTKYGYDVKAYSDAQQTAATIKAAGIRAAVSGGGGGEDKVINNLLMRAKGVDDSLTAYKKANESLIKRANLPGDTPEIKKMRADAQAKLNDDPDYKSLVNRKAQIDGLLNQYKKIRDVTESNENPSAGNDPLNIRKP
jgi:hypothetical protein